MRIPVHVPSSIRSSCESWSLRSAALLLLLSVVGSEIAAQGQLKVGRLNAASVQASSRFGNADGDSDGLSDAIELMGWDIVIDEAGYGDSAFGSLLTIRTVYCDPADSDSDDDGLNDLVEYLIGTDPMVVDTDGDGLTDEREWNKWFSNPSTVDSDADSRGRGSRPDARRIPMGRAGAATDTRHFNTDFARFVARVATENGCDVFLFTEPRSTPELSFAIRHHGLSTGIVLTASHNPPHDNGYKAYWDDGAQMVEPHASGVIAEVEKIESDRYQPLPEDQQGSLTEIGEDIDKAYMDKLETLLLDPEMVRGANDLKLVFTNIHGTGGKIIPQMLRRLGFHCDTVAEQDVEDGRFPTVDSPNPENAPPSPWPSIRPRPTAPTSSSAPIPMPTAWASPCVTPTANCSC